MLEGSSESAALNAEHASEESSSADRHSDKKIRKEINTPAGRTDRGCAVAHQHVITRFHICIAHLFSPSLKTK